MLMEILKRLKIKPLTMDINTITTKRQQLETGYFKIGSGQTTISIIGSCRAVPYVVYLNKYNEQHNNPYTICFIDPFNFNYDLKDNRIDMQEKINSLETDLNVLNLLRNTDIFIHEYYANFGMFNCDRSAEKNIYQFGMGKINGLESAKFIDICIPNWNDCFVLFNDILSFDTEMKKRALQDINVTGKLSDQTFREIKLIARQNYLKFYDVCGKSDMPDMLQVFGENFTKVRFFWNSNHVSKHFTLSVFHFIRIILNIHVSAKFLIEIARDDMYANNYTYLTEYDIQAYNYQWGEEIKPLKL